MLLQRDEIRFDFGSARLDPRQDRELLGWIFSQFLYGEVTGIQVGHWIHAAPDLDSARFLATQCAQELSHVRLMRRIFDRLGVEPQPAHRLVRFLSTGLMGASWEEHVCLEMALGEGYVLAVFYALLDTIPDAEIHRLLETATRQEETHVAFGEMQTQRAAAVPRHRRHLLGMSILSLAVLERLAQAAAKRQQSAHPVWRQLPEFARHVVRVSELRLQRMGLLDAPLATLPRVRRLGLVAAGALGRALAPLESRRRRRLTHTYLCDPQIARGGTLLGLLWLAVAAPAQSATWSVDPAGELSTIQAAVDSAASGDTLLLAPAVYSENPRILDKNLWIRSSGGGRAVIDAAPEAGQEGNTGSALRAVRSFVSIEDLELRNGVAVPLGAGVLVWGGHVELRRCRLENNVFGVLVVEPVPGTTSLEDCEVVNNGIGIWTFVRTRVTNTVFTDNWLGVRIVGQATLTDVEVHHGGAAWRWGGDPPFASGGLVLAAASGRLERVRVHDNQSTGGLSGIWTEVGPFEIVDCESVDNVSANGPAGLVFVRVTNALVQRCSVRGNVSRSAFVSAGGLLVDRSQVRVEQSRIENNDTQEHGGGVTVLRRSNLELVGTSILANRAGVKGGGIYASDSRVLCDSVQVLANTSGGGGGVAVDSGAEVELRRSTLAGNMAPGAGALFVVNGAAVLQQSIVAFHTGSPTLACFGTVTLRCVDVFGNSDDALCGADLGGNLALDPGFCAFDPSRGLYDVGLQASSPLAGVAACGPIGARGVGCKGVRASTWGEVKALYR